MHWTDIPGWFQWRSGQEEAALRFPEGATFVEVGNYLGRSLASLAEVAAASGKAFRLVGVDHCRGSGPEGPRLKDYHAEAVAAGGGTLAGQLHRNLVACGCADRVSLIVGDSATAASFFPDESLDWVHLDARHDRDGLEADVLAWLPKIARSGWLSGDDHDAVKWPDVVALVGELLPAARPWCASQWRWERP
ncbi:MAG: class I SAM-dependent methyltransferase [Vicinamibacteria bacterium]